MTQAVQNAFQTVKVGDGITWRKTISESDVYLFAGITGDLGPNHIDDQYMKSTVFKARIVQGVLTLGLSSAATWMFASKHGISGASLGYDRVRFVKAVKIGDTVTIDYQVAELDEKRGRIVFDVAGRDQDDEPVLFAQHILKVIPLEANR